VSNQSAARGPTDGNAELTLALDDSKLVTLVSGQFTAAHGVLGGRINVRGDIGRAVAALASALLSQPGD
jgi:putative sterol carrier protein